MDVHILQSPEEVIEQIAEDIVNLANECVEDHGRFTIALSGGSSPKKLYELLASEQHADNFPWENTFFFFGDERYVPSDSPDYNAGMAREAMLNKVNVPKENIFAVNTAFSPNEAANDYAHRILEHYQIDEPVFDLILLGLGDDAHTASLFPHTRVLAETDALVKEVKMLSDNSWRISFTRTLINKASNVYFMTFGEKKSEAVYHVLEGPRYEFQYPAQFIRPTNGKVCWYIDTAAATLLRNR